MPHYTITTTSCQLVFDIFSGFSRGGGRDFFCIFRNFSIVFYDSIPNICHYSELFPRLFAPSHVTHLPWGGVVVPPQDLAASAALEGLRYRAPAALAAKPLGHHPAPAVSAKGRNFSGTPGPRPPLPARPLRLALRAAWPPRRSGCACPFGAPPALLRRLAWPIGAGALRLAPAGAPPGGARCGVPRPAAALLTAWPPPGLIGGLRLARPPWLCGPPCGGGRALAFLRAWPCAPARRTGSPLARPGLRAGVLALPG